MTFDNEIKELSALVSLIDEPGEEIFDTIRRKILGYGTAAIPVLEEMWVNTMTDSNSKRIESIIEEIKQEELTTEFNLWTADSTNSIIDALMIITKYFQHNFNEKEYIALYDKLLRDTWLELNDNLTALEKIKVINHIFYQVYSFNCISEDYIKSDTFFINKIFDYKKGNAISMTILYMAITQTLNIPIFGVDLPGHFVLAYLDEDGNTKLTGEGGELDVMFYINAAKNGAIFTRNEIEYYLNEINIKKDTKYFEPCNNLAVMKLMISELIISLERENNESKTEVLKKLITELQYTNKDPESAQNKV